MFIYEKKLQFPVNISNPDPKLAKIIITQLGGPDGELAASMRYLNQRYIAGFDQGLLQGKPPLLVIAAFYVMIPDSQYTVTFKAAVFIHDTFLQSSSYGEGLCRGAGFISVADAEIFP